MVQACGEWYDYQPLLIIRRVGSGYVTPPPRHTRGIQTLIRVPQAVFTLRIRAVEAEQPLPPPPPKKKRSARGSTKAPNMGNRFDCTELLRGTIVDRTYHGMVYIKIYIFDHFYNQYLVLLTMVPRNRKKKSATLRYITLCP